MRIICPNCGAQYEVPDEVIPKSGRDVQCSNCGHTWFQPHPDHPQAAEPPPPRDEAGAPDWEEIPEETGEAPAEAAEAMPRPRAEAPAPREATEAEQSAARRRELDPEVARLLREEAEREARARAAEARGGLETQPDLGLSQAEAEAERRARQARARMARLRGEEIEVETKAEAEIRVETEVEIAPEPGSRRNLLPDIDETTSSITAEAAAPKPPTDAETGRAAAAPPPAAGGFRRGLRLAVALALVATFLYVFAPQISDTLPATAPALEAYVEKVNGLRIVVNDGVLGLIARLRGAAGG